MKTNIIGSRAKINGNTEFPVVAETTRGDVYLLLLPVGKGICLITGQVVQCNVNVGDYYISDKTVEISNG